MRQDKGLPILVVEDDDNLREAICDTLELAGQAVIAASGGKEALKKLEGQAVSLIVSDVRMMPMDGIALLKEIRKHYAHLPVVLMTAYADVDRAVEAMRSGACDFLLKPFEPKALLEHIARYRLPDVLADARVIANDQASKNLFGLAARVAQTDTTVLLTGESGVGKEVVARYIHNHSARKNAPFVAINCAAIPDSLLEATLFGYEKGAFTGAQQMQPGKFEQAEGGTLLMDEVTEMPLGLQAKLLRVLQEREVERVGGKKPIPLNIRIIATSNRNMAEAVSKGVLREDVYYRLNVFPLLIPALRQRRDDIVPLAQHFLVEHSKNESGRAGLRFSTAAEKALRAYDWPGNVRELENVMQRALIFSIGATIEEEALFLPSDENQSDAPLKNSLLMTPTTEKLAQAENSKETEKTSNMNDLEREHILKTLAETEGSRKLTCERLGMSERTLRHKLKQYKEAGFFTEET